MKCARQGAMARALPYIFSAASLVHCTGVDRKNPFDPTTPEATRQKASLRGVLSSEDGSGLGALDATLVMGEKRFAASVSSQGEMYVEAASGTYSLEIRGARFRPYVISGLNLQPGEARDIGGVLLSLQRGALSGSVTLSQTARSGGAEGVSIVLTERTTEARFTTQTDVSGSFSVSGVPVGDYRVTASRTDYAPAYTSAPVSVAADGAAIAPRLTLYPASAVLQVVANGVTGGRYTSTRTVPLQLLAFVNQLTQMRVSLDRTFSDASLGDIDFQPFAATRDVTLRDEDGEQAIFAQFRDDDGLQSDIFSTRVILDREAPTHKSLSLDEGRRYMSGATARLQASAFDNLSGIRGYILSLDPLLTGAAESLALSTQSSVDLSLTQSFSNADGDKFVYLSWVDRAGNVSAPVGGSIAKDTTPPLLSSVIINEGASVSSDTAVSVVLTATDASPGEVAEMQVSESAAFAGANWEPFVAQRALVIGSSNGAHTIYARVRDGAGQISGAASSSLTLDTIAPTITSAVILGAGAGFVNQRLVSLQVSAADNLSLGVDLELAVASPTLDCATANYAHNFTNCVQAPCTATFTDMLTLSAGDGEKKIQLCVRDAARLTTALPSTATVILDETPPLQVTSLVASPGSRRAIVSFALLQDNSVAQYEVDVGTEPTFDPPLRTLVGLPANQSSAIVDDLDNRTEYFFRVRAIDRANNVGPYSASASVIVGVAGGRAPLVMTGARDPWFFGPRLLVDQGRLWMTTRDYSARFNDQRPLTTSILSCAIAQQDCRLPNNWRQALTPAGNSAIDPSSTKQHRTVDHPMMVTDERIYTAGLVNVQGNTPRVELYSCEHNKDCAAGSSNGMTHWNESVLTQLDGNLGEHLAPTVTLAQNAARVFVAYRTTTNANMQHFVPEIATCRVGASCYLDSHFSRARITDSEVGTSTECELGGFGITPNASLCAMDSAASDAGYWLAYRDDVQHDLRITTCSMRANSVCTDVNDFSSFSIAAAAAAPSFAKTSTRLYLSFASESDDGSLQVMRCDDSSLCATAGAFSGSTVVSASETGGRSDTVSRLRYAGAALHLSYWSQSEQRIRYLRCAEPDLVDCTDAANWTRPMTFAAAEPSTAVPDMVFFGPNQVLAYEDVLGVLRLRLPFFSTPSTVVTSMGGGAGVVTTWPDMAYVDGYIQHYGSTAAELDSRAVLTDPTATNALLSTSFVSDTFVSLASKKGDETGDLSRRMRTRSALRVDLTAPNISELSTSNGSSRWVYSGATSSTQHYVFFATGAGLAQRKFVAHCELQNGCPELTPVELPAGLGDQGGTLTLSNSRLHVVSSTGTSAMAPAFPAPGDLLYSVCELSSACDETTDWSTPIVLNATPNTVHAEGLSVTSNGASILVLARHATNALVAYECADSAACSLRNQWSALDVEFQADSGASYSVAHDRTQTAAGSLFSKQTVGGGTGVFVTTFTDAHSPMTLAEVRSSGTLLASAIDAGMSRLVLLTSENNFTSDSVAVNYCEQGSSTSCLQGANLSTRWSTIKFPVTLGTQAQPQGSLHIVDGVIYVTIALEGQVMSLSCAKQCWKREQWHQATLLRDASLVLPHNGSPFFTMAADARTFFTFAQRGRGLSALLSGKSVPLE